MNPYFLPLMRFAEAMCRGNTVKFRNGVLSSSIAEGMVDADTIAKFGGIAEIIEPPQKWLGMPSPDTNPRETP